MTNSNVTHAVVMNVGPDQALRWLEGNVNNRPLDDDHVNRLAGEMKAGRWKLTHQGIAFDVHGVLQDGQHRLWAIAMSKCTVPLMVAFNAPSDSLLYVDGGKGRSIQDRMKLSGRFGKDGVDKDELAAMRVMTGVFNVQNRPAISVEMDLLAKHRKAIDFAVENLRTTRIRGVGSSVVCAVVARAWYSTALANLTRFCEVLLTGLARGPEEAVIILLRDYLSATGRPRSRSALRDQYGKVERALHAYLNGKPLSLLRACQTELFLLPSEVVKVA